MKYGRRIDVAIKNDGHALTHIVSAQLAEESSALVIQLHTYIGSIELIPRNGCVLDTITRQVNLAIHQVGCAAEMPHRQWVKLLIVKDL